MQPGSHYMVGAMKKHFPSALIPVVLKVLLLLSAAFLLLTIWGCGCSSETHSRSASNSPVAASNAVQAEERVEKANEILRADLPPEARETLQLIKSGGPFPYAKDGAVFGNREGLLMAKPRGYYHEYTVPTPGTRDRDARRIIAGKNGEYYYTDDHYRSFRRIRE
jgi:ribonuclease T1